MIDFIVFTCVGLLLIGLPVVIARWTTYHVPK